MPSFGLRGFIVYYLKDLIHIYLRPAAQDPSRTLEIFLMSNNPYLLHKVAKKQVLLKGTLNAQMLCLGHVRILYRKSLVGRGLFFHEGYLSSLF